MFRDNDRPGVMLAGAAQAYVNRWGVLPGKRAVLLTNNDSAYGAALDLRTAGVEIAAVVDLRADPDGRLTQLAEDGGIKILPGHAVTAVEGGQKVTGVRVASLDGTGTAVAESAQTLACDLVLNAGGFTPTVHLFSQAKGKLAWDEARHWFHPGAAGQPAQRSAGAANGTWGLGATLAEGHAAGIAAATGAGFTIEGGAAAASAADEDFLPLRALWLVPSTRRSATRASTSSTSRTTSPPPT